MILGGEKMSKVLKVKIRKKSKSLAGSDNVYLINKGQYEKMNQCVSKRRNKMNNK